MQTAVSVEHHDNDRPSLREQIADRLGYTMDEFCAAVPCSRPTAYAAIRDGRLKAKKLGTRTIIPAPDARDFIAKLPDLDLAA
jgi:excisionase family DNA binding protein